MKNKLHILTEIKRLADLYGGKAPGIAVFSRETGIRREDWFPHIWLRWGNAVTEAGYTANQMQSALNDEIVVNKYVELIRELGKIPIKGELLRKSNADKTFPSEKPFYRGGKSAFLERVKQYCQNHSSYEDIIILCSEYLLSQNNTALNTQPDKKSKVTLGFVYLMRSGRHYKIGRTNSLGSRERQLAIKIPVPPTTIHSIETDDPAGVEAYWHKRFADKRGEGEWFDLSVDDVSAFKRWKRIA